jgi:signal transduction histidine kinase
MQNLNNRLLDIIIYLTVVAVGLGGVWHLPSPSLQYISIGLLILLLLGIAFYRPMTSRSNVNNQIGMAILTLLVSCLLIIEPGWSTFPILFFALAPISTVTFPIRRALLWISIFALITVIIFIWFQGLEGLIMSFSYVCGYLFFGIFGYLMVQAQESRKRTEELLIELQMAHQKLQDYANQLEELTIDRERNRLAREVHDTLGHQLTVSVVQLEGAQRLISSDPQRAFQMVATVREQVKSGLGELRRIVATLRTPENEDAPLSVSYQKLVHHFQEATGIIIQLQMPEILPSLANPVRSAFYRSLQEALTNVQKHAHASQVVVKLNYHDHQLCLSVRDNGVGISLIGKGGFGWKGLKERASLLGGSFETLNAPEGGTILDFSVPILEENNHE